MKIIKGIINVLTTLIIVIGGLFLILYFCGVVPYVVLSGSMEPTIETGSVCFINKNTKISSIKEKDIIAFKFKDGTLVTHRAIKITDSGITTKGDNNEDIDGNKVTKENFVGKNIIWIPKVGYLIKACQTTKGKIILFTIVILLFVSGFLFGEDKKKKLED
ncbi:MAG: signal peptidase I [Bacilli bacterium]|nr:signal peptidase I [Bacilli bacterium]